MFRAQAASKDVKGKGKGKGKGAKGKTNGGNADEDGNPDDLDAIMAEIEGGSSSGPKGKGAVRSCSDSSTPVHACATLFGICGSR